jgi:predicted acetyltransferase
MSAAELLVLRSPRLTDEKVVATAQAELAVEDFEFVFQRPDQSWAEYVNQVQKQRLGVEVPPGQVPATFLLAERNGQVVGRVSIRHELNDWLQTYGGHIGYVVRPAYRRRGIATEILRRSLPIARSAGLDRVLLICDESNVGSIRTIESCGGWLEGRGVEQDGVPTLRYWIATSD